jgi:hypothetical protein
METKAWRAGRSVCRLQGWGDFRREIATFIRLLGEAEGRFIIFSERSRHRFVQFCSLREGAIKGEAVSNNFLEKGGRLTAATCRNLLELGWQKPAAKTSPNFWFVWQPRLPIDGMVSLALTTLRSAFEVASPGDLEICCDSWNPAVHVQGKARLKRTRVPGLALWYDGVNAWSTISGPRGRGIKVKSIGHFNARGMRRVYGRGDIFPLDGQQTYKRNMDVWLTREGRLLARFWALGSEVDDESFEIIGLSHPPVREKEEGLSDEWVPQRLRNEYKAWVISNSETPRSAFGL